jgi:manganese transport protein
MGEHAIKLPLKLAAWATTAVLVYLNLRMVSQEAFSYFSTGGHWFVKILILAGGAGFILLLLITLLFPWLRQRRRPGTSRIHLSHISLGDLAHPRYQRIAVALDFSKNDEKVISSAVAQGNDKTTYLLIHIVESVSARMLGRESDDYESRQDQAQLDTYVTLLKQRNIRAKGMLGHYNRAKEIVRLVKEQQADLLVLGGHGHRGLKDWLYGETVNYVRHYVHIPVLIVN